MYKLINIYLILFCSFIPFSKACAQENIIEIDYAQETGVVNRKILGNNFLGYDPATYEDWTKEYRGFSDYGAGIWDPQKKETIKEVIDLAKSAGIVSARFPGGCGAHRYNWKDAIGKERKRFLFGIDEFLKVCAEIVAEPIFTLSYFAGNAQDAADIVAYLNSPLGAMSDNLVTDWAQERAKNGHIQPYNVKYFEFGNEEWHGDHKRIKRVRPEEYAAKYSQYRQKMKAQDAAVSLGVILNVEPWNKKVLEMVKEKIDFVILHLYAGPELREDQVQRMNPKEIFKISLAMPILQSERTLQEINRLLKIKTNQAIPIAVTEYNVALTQNQPIPYRYSLGSALVNAELIRIFMKPEYNILLANFWNFTNEYWGLINNGFFDKYEELTPKYYKQASYYVFELYNRHFGDSLVKNSVYSQEYQVENTKIPYLSVNTGKNQEGSILFIMVVNKNLDKSMQAKIELKNFTPSEFGQSWTLNGSAIETTNQKEHDSVKVSQNSFKIDGAYFTYTFEPHSITAIEIKRKL